MTNQPEHFDRRHPEVEASDRRHDERRKSPRLYWVIGLLFLVFMLSLVVPPIALHCPAWARFILLVIIAALCLVDRRGLTLRHFAGMSAMCGVGCACLFAAAWHTPQAALYGILTAVFAVFSLALFNIKGDPRIR